MIDREKYIDDYGLQVDPLFDIIDKKNTIIDAQTQSLHDLKHDADEMSDTIKRLREGENRIMEILDRAIKTISNPLIQNDIYNESGLEDWHYKKEILLDKREA